MKTALFTNFSNEEFIGYWNGKGKKFAPGQSVYMPDYLAKHFAKHLTNRELLKKGLERDTSPKLKTRKDSQGNTEEYIDNVNFLELFNKAYTPDGEEEFSAEKDSIDVQIEVANKNRAEKGQAASLPESMPSQEENERGPSMNPQPKEQDPTQPQVVDLPVDDEDDETGFGDQNPNNN